MITGFALFKSVFVLANRRRKITTDRNILSVKNWKELHEEEFYVKLDNKYLIHNLPCIK